MAHRVRGSAAVLQPGLCWMLGVEPQSQGLPCRSAAHVLIFSSDLYCKGTELSLQALKPLPPLASFEPACIPVFLQAVPLASSTGPQLRPGSRCSSVQWTQGSTFICWPGSGKQVLAHMTWVCGCPVPPLIPAQLLPCSVLCSVRLLATLDSPGGWIYSSLGRCHHP